MKPAVTRALLTVSLGWMALSVWWPLWFLFFGALTPADELAATIGPALHDGENDGQNERNGDDEIELPRSVRFKNFHM